MRKTILYLLILGILGFGVYYFLFAEKNVFGVNEANFTVKDTGNIGKIFLAKQDGTSITLERKGDRWLLNGKYDAIQSVVNDLLSTMSKQQAQFPVPKTTHNTAVSNMAASAIKVELYSRGGDKMRTFHVGGQANNRLGSYMLMEGAERPYVVQMPGFEGYLTPRYSTDLATWRDRSIVILSPDRIDKISIHYDQEPLNSFDIKRVNADSVGVIIDPALMKGKDLNLRRLNTYLSFFNGVYHEGFINGTIGLDSIISNTDKKCTIKIAGEGTDTQLDVYWMPISKRSKNRLFPDVDIETGYDADRFYGVLDTKDTIIIQIGTFDKIFRLGYEFYEKDAQ